MVITVAKFGGSSLSTESQFAKVKNIVNQDSSKQIVVVSAIGRKNSQDDKVTDLLYLISAHIKHHVSYQSLWDNFTARFLAVKKDLNLSYDIEADLDNLKMELEIGQFNQDYLVSRGEYLTARLMAEYLSYDFVDAASIIVFSEKGIVDLEASKSRLENEIQNNRKVVIPGFYGAYKNGRIKLLSRGGSDITGAILARCLGVDRYENWTDVSGVLVADPRIIKNPVTIKELTYEELSELSYMGASVLHEETIYPIKSLNIPIHIKNTNDPTASGTTILAQSDSSIPRIAGISAKKNYISINILKNQMSIEIGFLGRALKIFEDYNLNIEHIPTGINQLGIIVEKAEVEDALLDILERLKSELAADEVTVKEGISLFTVVGEGIIKSSKTTSKIFSSLAKQNIDIELIAQSPRGINIIIGIADKEYDEALKALYSGLFEEIL